MQPVDSIEEVRLWVKRWTDSRPLCIPSSNKSLAFQRRNHQGERFADEEEFARSDADGSNGGSHYDSIKSNRLNLAPGRSEGQRGKDQRRELGPSPWGSWPSLATRSLDGQCSPWAGIHAISRPVAARIRDFVLQSCSLWSRSLCAHLHAVFPSPRLASFLD